MKKKYMTPVCEASEMEVKTCILEGSGNSLRVDNEPNDVFFEGDVNQNNGWNLW